MESILSPLRAMAQMNTSRLASFAVPLGALFHMAISHESLDFEHIMYHFIAVSVLAYISIIITFVQIGENNLSSAIVKTSTLTAAFNTGLLSSMAVYRAFFHRCRKFPGPFPARISRFYATYKFSRDFKYYKELEKMHAQYGDFVRTGPRELSILNKDAIPLIYGLKSECRKSIWYEQGGADPNKVSINMTRDMKGYRLRRRAWDRGLSIKSITNYQPRIKAKVDLLIEQLRKRKGEPVDATKWSMFLAFDIMGEIGFGKDFANLTSAEEHPAIKAIHDHIKMLGIMSTVPWLLNLFGALPGAAAPFAGFYRICREQMGVKDKEYDEGKGGDPRDIAGWLMKAVKEKDVSASPTPESIQDDARVIIVAGSDTTSNTLANILYYLAAHPPIQSKLHNLLTAAIPSGPGSWTYDSVKQITYLDDIINETLRLKPPVVNIPSRVIPLGGFRVGTTFIPGNVHVSVPTILIQRDPRLWVDAERFVPERWGDRRAEMGTEEAVGAFMPFNLGMHSCPGMNLAFLSLRTAVSRLVLEFEVELMDGEMGRVFDEEWEDTLLITLRPLWVRFRRRV